MRRDLHSWRTGIVMSKIKREGTNIVHLPFFMTLFVILHYSFFYRIHEVLNISAVQEETILLLEELVQTLEQKIETLTELYIGL